MLEELKQIDVSSIEELMAIKRDREVISGRLARLAQEQAKVSEVVVRRVRRDYESRLAGLERKAFPLKERARQEYVKLKALLDRLEAQHQSVRLDREEVELRNHLGEYTEEEFARRCRELEDRLASLEADLDEARALRTQFVEAFDSEAELVPSTAPAVAPSPASPVSLGPLAIPPDAVSSPLPPSDAAITAPQPIRPTVDVNEVPPPPPPPPRLVPPPFVPPPPPAPAVGEPDGTVLLPPEPPAPFVAPVAAAASPGLEDPMGATALLSVPEAPPSPGKTVVLTRGKLIAIDTDLGATEFLLEPLTFLGRTPENTIRLNKPAVSRRHAQITQTEKGYILKDLNSENGTYVNGERIKERMLQDGDRVQIGTVRFVFHAS
jgi:hypothetical protein